MLYLTFTAILIGSCAIETSATKLLVTSTSNNTQKDLTIHAREVTPITKGRVGWAISYARMLIEFPNLDFKDELTKQLTASFNGKPLNHLDIAVNMWARPIPISTVPGNIVATYIDSPNKFGLYHKEGNITWSDFYFEADKE